VAGYTLGGGIGWLGREYGLASTHVLAIEVVTADGRVRRVDAANDPDLFWALRGGGGDFGIVTGIEMQAFPVESVYAGSFFWPAERAREVFAVWADWAPRTPDELSSCARFFNFPPLEFIPEPFRGRSLVSVEVVFHGPVDAGQRLAQPFVDLAPEIGGCDVMPVANLMALHQDPPNPGPSVGDGILLENFPDDVTKAFCDTAASDVGRRLVSIEVRQTGGAMARPADGAGVLTSLPGSYAVYAAGVAAPGVDPADLHASVAAVKQAVRPAATRLGYTNFSHEPSDLSPFFAEVDLSRLREVKQHYDPTNVIRGTNPVAG
jgi:FAD/FMN-containing dehydrogenase